MLHFDLFAQVSEKKKGVYEGGTLLIRNRHNQGLHYIARENYFLADNLEYRYEHVIQYSS